MRIFQMMRPSHLGLMTIHMWIYCAAHRLVPTGGVSVMTVMYLFLSAFLIVVFLVVWRRSLTQKHKRGMDKLGIAMMSVSALLLTVPSPVSGAATTFVGSALGGIGVVWAYSRWIEFYSELDIYYATPLIFLTMAIGSLGKTVIDFLPALPAGIVLMILPFFTYATLYRSQRTRPGTSVAYRYYNSRTIGSLGRLALGIAVYSVTVGIIQSMPLDVMPSSYFIRTIALDVVPASYYAFVLTHHGGEVVLSLLLFAWVSFFKRGLNFSRIWRLVLLLMATTLLFAPHLNAVIGSYLFAFIGIAQTFMIIFLFLALADIARHSSYRPMLIFAAGWICYALPFALGDIIGLSLQVLAPAVSGIMSVIVWALVVVTLFCLDESSVGKRLIFIELNDGGGEDTPANRIGVQQQVLNEQRATDMLSARCSLLGEHFHLTPREREIVELLARGRSKAYIAEAFFVSENTVRGHVKRLYAKLEVHNKQELVDRIESTDMNDLYRNLRNLPHKLPAKQKFTR
jgi:DNA-binding CsgD family transcriptional regulator